MWEFGGIFPFQNLKNSQIFQPWKEKFLSGVQARLLFLTLPLTVPFLSATVLN